MIRFLGAALLALVLLASHPLHAQSGGALIDEALRQAQDEVAAIDRALEQLGATQADLEALAADLDARVTALEGGAPPESPPSTIGTLSLCPDNRSICVDGARRFLLGDTAWWAPSRMSFADWRDYLAARKRQGFDFTMIVAAMRHPNGSTAMQPNLAGDLPIVGGDFRRLDPAFWSELNRWISEAARQGLYVGVLPVWGAAYFPDNPASTATDRFDLATARAYCAGAAQALGGNDNIVWILGGDHGPTKTVTLADGSKKTLDYRPIVDLCAEAIEANSGQSFIGYHTWTDSATCYRLSGKPWLRFHSTQTGHPNKPVWLDATVKGCWTSAAALRDPKPTANLEPWYEGLTKSRAMARWNPGGGVAGPREVRREAYWSVIGWGTALHAYGHADVVLVCRPGETCKFNPGGDWRVAIEAGGARDMRHVKAFAQAVGQLTPDAALLAGNVSDFEHIVAARGDGLIAAYTYDGGNVIRLRLGSLGGTLAGYWFNPRDGSKVAIAPFANPGAKTFTPPSTSDWALVIATQPGA